MRCITYRCITPQTKGVPALRYKFKFKSLRVVKFLEFYQKQTHKPAKFKAAKILNSSPLASRINSTTSV
ncbi:hypothetical protein [uncultured Campylobacter sp.]|uniref:hypothetical protein n=1 Tax=uncultured Campylobacter sp. TaxID=218934 RepID=UPI00261340BD|nr:hypothetical protein [uncultured Campylobacter sp.]